jgi:hypothetical protein
MSKVFYILKGVYVMRKMDEMEMNINLKAIKWSWLFTAIALLIWAV